MGLFDFIKSAGKSLGDSMSLTQSLKEELSRQGLQVDDLALYVKDGVATVKGKVKTQADREKVILVLGNTKGVERVVDYLEVTQPAPEAVFYTVKRGDTLSKIAKTYYGKASMYMKIFEANQPLLKDPDKIYPGQVLRIPPAEVK